MKITCNLYSQWIAALRAEITKAGGDDSDFGDQDCAIRWQSWMRRIVPPAKRTIEKADSFSCPGPLQQGLDGLEKAFSNGAEVWPWQSKLIDQPSFEDGLFNDYRVVHFHLGSGTDKGGYISRTNELLFAVVDATSVYEIGIYAHGDWYELDILDIIDRNWPELLNAVTLQGVSDVKCPTTREEVQILREGNVNSIMKLASGRIIAPPGGGMATDGTSVEAVRGSDVWARVLRNGENLIRDNIQDQVSKGLMPEQDFDVRLHMTADEIAGVAGGQKWILWKRT